MPGDTVPGTQFRLGAENNDASIQSLRNWSDYAKTVAILHPGEASGVGFLGRNEDWGNLLLADAQTRRRLNVTSSQLADWIDQALKLPDGKYRTEGTVVVNGQTIEIRWNGTKGIQESPLPGPIATSTGMFLLRNVKTGFRLKGTLTEMHADLIRYWGFHEGHAQSAGTSGYGFGDTYRVAPEDLYELFTGKHTNMIAVKEGVHDLLIQAAVLFKFSPIFPRHRNTQRWINQSA